MNDFTKEELAALIDYLDHPVLELSGHEGLRLQLCNKIQSMINDYPKCDHRSGFNYYNERGEAVSFDTGIYRCRYCDILFKFITENGICTGHEELE